MKVSKILILTQVPPEFYVRGKLDPTTLVPDFQVQHQWLVALKKLGIEVKLDRYDLVHSRWDFATFSLWLKSVSPTWWSHYRHLRNRMYRWWLPNLLRSLRVLSLVREYSPQLILCTGGISHLSGFLLSTLKQKSIPMVLLHGENPVFSATRFEKDGVRDFAAIVTNDPDHAIEWIKFGANKAFAGPYAAASENHLSISENKTTQILSLSTLSPQRITFLEQMLRIDPELPIEIFGYVPPQVTLSRRVASRYKGEAWGQEAILLMARSRIVLNLQPDHMPIGANMRTFEIPALKAVQVANRVDPTLFTTDEIVVATTPKAMVTVLRELLENQTKCEQIALAGWKRVKSEHTYEQRFNKILELL